ncbi:hypothetical protein MCHI_002843 [Candidatus Magnetoovum chiemensis]|nr:hypothetical protein MCHI_002843 [Candidatus Magnetoovum chiemensis]
MKTYLNEKGGVKNFIWMIVLIIGLYAGFLLIMPYYNYSSFKSEAKEIARLGGDVEKTTAMLFEKATELKLPIAQGDIAVTRDEEHKTITIQTSWKQKVNVMGLFEKQYNFTINVKE